MLRLACTKCARRGQYRNPRRRGNKITDLCGRVCADLDPK